jgi:hypothetical protein
VRATKMTYSGLHKASEGHRIRAWKRGASRGQSMTRRRITVAEAAEVLSISVEAVRGQIKRGTLVLCRTTRYRV